jgi:hypothetical protein
MATWKKVILWFLGFVFVIAGGCAVLLDRFDRATEGLCDITVIEEIISPSGKLKAVVFQIDCGATTGFNTQISIVPTETEITQKSNLPQSFFVADGNHRQAPAGKGDGPELRIHWENDENLEVQYHSNAHLIRAERKFKEIAVYYTTFR